MKKIINCLLNILSPCLIFAAFWAIDTFGNFNGDEIFFHLLVPLGGINNDVFSNLLTNVFIPGIIIGIILSVIINKFIKKRKTIITIVILLLSLIISFEKIDFFTYISDQINSSEFIKENYVETKKVNIKFPDEKKNLIYIYLESMENTYSNTKNGGIKKENLIPNLTKLAKENISFSNNETMGGALPINGTSWTAAAIVGQTSGIPLKINVSSNGIIDLNNFFPNTKTLGDILEENGYKNYLLVGSDANYGCRKQYFQQHGNYEIYDLNTAIKEEKMTKEDKVWWGFDDTTLYEYAKKQLTEISKNKEPFNYTLLTADTHFEDGYLTKECDKNYKDQYSNVISCADKKINDFINWLEKQNFYENTTIIIIGDHLSMDTDYFKNNKDNYQRTVYNTIINSSVKAKNTQNRLYTTLDIFPTTLASLGAKIEGDKLGLGTNLYSDKKTIVEEYGYKYIFKELNKRSTFYNNNVLAYK